MGVAENRLTELNLFVDGRGFAGNVKEIKLPELALKTEEFRAAGMDASIELDKGMEKLELTFSATKQCAETLSLFGVSSNNGVQLSARGSLENYDGTVTPVVVNMTGKVTKISAGAWQPGGDAATEYTVNLSYYKYTQDGTVLHEIDILNYKRIVNGTDQLAEKRAALGL